MIDAGYCYFCQHTLFPRRRVCSASHLLLRQCQ